MRRIGPQNRIGEDEFLEDGAAKFGPQVQVPHARAQFGPREPRDDFGTGHPVDPDMAPSAGGVVLAIILRGAGLEENDIAGPGPELPALEANEAVAELGVEQEKVLGALGPPAVDASAHILVLGLERADRKAGGFSVGGHGTILYVFGRRVYSPGRAQSDRVRRMSSHDTFDYLFDLRGYVILKNAVDSRHLAELNQAFDRFPDLPYLGWWAIFSGSTTMAWPGSSCRISSRRANRLKNLSTTGLAGTAASLLRGKRDICRRSFYRRVFCFRAPHGWIFSHSFRRPGWRRSQPIPVRQRHFSLWPG